MTNVNSNCDKTQKLKLWQLKIQIVMKLKNSNSNCDKAQKLKLSEEKNSNSNCDKNLREVIVKYFSKNNLTHWQPMRCSQDRVCQFSRCFSELCPVESFHPFYIFLDKLTTVSKLITDIATNRLNQPRGQIIWNAWQGGKVEMGLTLKSFSRIHGTDTRPAIYRKTPT